MKGNQLARLLAYVTGLVNHELLLENEYLAAENLILHAHLPARLRLSDPERRTLAEIGKRVGRKALEKVACVANWRNQFEGVCRGTMNWKVQPRAWSSLRLRLSVYFG